MSKLLEISRLNVTYNDGRRAITAVKDASLTVPRGEVVGLVGESGSGKTTLANAILGILPRTASVNGSIRFNGSELVGMDDLTLNQIIRWRQIAIVFQKALAALSPVHRIEEHLIDVLHAHEPNAPLSQIQERLVRLMTSVRLPPETLHSYPHQLSGGMLQRVMIALSLLFDPPFIILDEATTALDVLTQKQILNEIHRLQREFSLTVLMISHDIAAVAENANRMVVMYASQIVEDGPVQMVIEQPAHPYTQALLAALPRLDGPRRRIQSIPGALPDLSRPIEHCVFAPRCAYALEMCWQATPPVRTPRAGHSTKCVLATEVQTA